jgi:hypothetical protein
MADDVLAAQIRNGDASLVVLQYLDDLFFRKAAALHALVLLLGQSELQTWLKTAKMTARPPCVTMQRPDIAGEANQE